MHIAEVRGLERIFHQRAMSEVEGKEYTIPIGDGRAMKAKTHSNMHIWHEQNEENICRSRKHNIQSRPAVPEEKRAG